MTVTRITRLEDIIPLLKPLLVAAKGGKGGGGKGSPNPNLPSRTGNPSGGGRGNNPSDVGPPRKASGQQVIRWAVTVQS